MSAFNNLGCSLASTFSDTCMYLIKLHTLHLNCNLYLRHLFWHFSSLKFYITLHKFSCTGHTVLNMIIELEGSNVSNFLSCLFKINMYYCFLNSHFSFFQLKQVLKLFFVQEGVSMLDIELYIKNNFFVEAVSK